MAIIETSHFGALEYSSDSEFEFPLGIPGFEQQTRFLLVEQPGVRPFVFMQSLHDSKLCFLALPVQVVDANYSMELGEEDREILGIRSGPIGALGQNVICLVLVTVAENAEPTANLRAPLVLSLRNRKGVQLIQAESIYSFRHPIRTTREMAECSC